MLFSPLQRGISGPTKPKVQALCHLFETGFFDVLVLDR